LVTLLGHNSGPVLRPLLQAAGGRRVHDNVAGEH